MLEPVPCGLVWIVSVGLGVDKVESRVSPQYITVPVVGWWNWRVIYESCQAQSCYVPETERNTGTSPKNIFNISVVDLVSFVNEVPEIVPETKFYVFRYTQF